MSDPTKIRGFRNVSTSRQAVFITDNGEAEISQISPRRWKVLPRGGKAYEVNGKQQAIEEARGIATGLTPSVLRDMQEKQRGIATGLTPSVLRDMQEKQRKLQSSLPAEPPKSRAQIKREIDEVLASMEPGLRSLARRSLDAEDRFLEYAMEHGRLDRDQARVALAAFRKARVIKFDAVNGTFHVKHGALLEPDVIRRAAGVD